VTPVGSTTTVVNVQRTPGEEDVFPAMVM
jgi:hypothetical protein